MESRLASGRGNSNTLLFGRLESGFRYRAGHPSTRSRQASPALWCSAASCRRTPNRPAVGASMYPPTGPIGPYLAVRCPSSGRPYAAWFDPRRLDDKKPLPVPAPTGGGRTPGAQPSGSRSFWCSGRPTGTPRGSPIRCQDFGHRVGSDRFSAPRSSFPSATNHGPVRPRGNRGSPSCPAATESCPAGCGTSSNSRRHPAAPRQRV